MHNISNYIESIIITGYDLRMFLRSDNTRHQTLNTEIDFLL